MEKNITLRVQREKMTDEKDFGIVMGDKKEEEI
jgi:hypothetical protein